MGTVGGGLWKTTNAGVIGLTSQMIILKHHQLEQSQFESDSRIVYVGMGEHAPRGVTTSFGDGVYKSTDSGETWEHMGLKETHKFLE